MTTYRYGTPCLACSGCHGGDPCQAPHEGGAGYAGAAAFETAGGHKALAELGEEVFNAAVVAAMAELEALAHGGASK